jgi:hypothetical protein
MAYEHRPGSFSLFKNDKGDNDKRPDYKGSGKDLAGVDIQVSAWLRDGKGEGAARWLSCKIEPARERQQPEPARPDEHRTPPQQAVPPVPTTQRGDPFADMPDDIPF